jgi:hypothetical protein
MEVSEHGGTDVLWNRLGSIVSRMFCALVDRRLGLIIHGPLKLRTAHLSDNTKIYESKMFFPDLKALLCQDHTQNFRSIDHSSKKITSQSLLHTLK